MKNDYMYIKDRFEKAVIRTEQNYNNALTKIETLLKMPFGELGQPATSPQFFLVNITGNEKEAVASKVMTDLMKSFDFTSLKNMLGK